MLFSSHQLRTTLPLVLVGLVAELLISIPSTIANPGQHKTFSEFTQGREVIYYSELKDKTKISNVVESLSLNYSLKNDDSGSYITAEIPEINLHVEAKEIDSQKFQQLVKIRYTIGNNRSENISILNNLPFTSRFKSFSSAPYYPELYTLKSSSAVPYQNALHGWDNRTDSNTVSKRMFLAKTPHGRVPSQISYLVIPGSTVIGTNQSFTEEFEFETVGKSYDDVKESRLKFCVQIVLNNETISALPDKPLVMHLYSDLPHLSRAVYSTRSHASLPLIPNSKLLCKNVLFS